MAFDYYAFSETLDEVETLLGYLKGNELAMLYLQSVEADLISLSEDPATAKPTEYGTWDALYLDESYKFPCPDGRYAVTPFFFPDADVRLSFWFWYPQPGEGSPSGDQFRTEVQAKTDQAWQQGPEWATGIASYCRSVCDQFTQVDAPTVANAIQDIQTKVLLKLKPEQDIDDGGWAKISKIETFWTGQGATAFEGFYDGFTAAEGRVYSFSADIMAAFGVFALLTHETQVSAQNYVESVRDNLKKQLESWVDRKTKPTDPPTVPSWWADAKEIAGDAWGVAGDIPGVSEVTGAVDKFVGTVTDVKKLVTAIATISGADINKPHPEVKIEGSEQIYAELTNTVYNNYWEGYEHSLDQLQNGDPNASPPTDPNSPVPFSVTNAKNELDYLLDKKDPTNPLGENPSGPQWFPDDVTSTGSMYEKGNPYPR